MSYPIKYPTPQGANIQIFNGGDSATTNHTNSRRWIKPQGASFVYFSLIGAGGRGGSVAGGGTGNGGGSGAVTNFMCPAFLIPDDLQVVVGIGDTTAGGGGNTKIVYQQKTGTGYDLLTANGGGAGSTDTNGIGGTAMTANYFTPMGFFQSVAGQDGTGSNITASTTTFLSGGPGNGQGVTANYGYSVASTKSGFFMTQPIIVGVSNGGNMSTTISARTAIGCGGSGANDNTGYIPSQGGDGMVVIITW
jgi:hypothetical protein